MSGKKIAIIAVSIFLVAFVVLFFVFYSKSQNAQIKTQQQDQQNTFPQETQQGGITDINIQKQFDNVANSPIVSDSGGISKNVSGGEIKDQNGYAISLYTIMPALKFSISTPLLELLGSSAYQFFSCSNSNGRQDRGLLLIVANTDEKLLGGRDGRDRDIVAAEKLKNWEGQMLSDLHNILFPGMNFSEQDLNQKLIFKDGTSRYAEFDLPDGTKGSINYRMELYTIFISTSRECLLEGSNALFND